MFARHFEFLLERRFSTTYEGGQDIVDNIQTTGSASKVALA